MRGAFGFAVFLVLGTLVTAGCNEKQHSAASAAPPKQAEDSAGPTEASGHRFIFPAQSTPFAAASVALDTRTGRLCKTYPWPDTQSLPGGLSLCSEAADSTCASLTGATTEYLGFTYTFDGSKWTKGKEAKSYNPKTRDMDPWSADQYDPLGLFSKEEKAKRLLSVSQIQAVGNNFGVSYQDALQDAKNQGYQVPK
jgi:hypothetical protein